MRFDVRRYGIVIRGSVQSEAYRKRIESTASILGIRGYDFDDVDGSIKVVCEGTIDSLDRFLKDIEIKETPSGISVESVDRTEIPPNFPLPPQFARLETEALTSIGRKLDRCNESLESIARSTEYIRGSIKGVEVSMKNVEGSLNGVESILGRMESAQETHAILLEGIGKSVDSLPGKIARAMRLQGR